MSEIFVEEENTVYELDEECLRRKGEMGFSGQRNGIMKKQSMEGGSKLILIAALLCCFK